MNENSGIFSIEAPSRSSIYGRLENLYLRGVRNLFVFLVERKMNFLAGALTTFLIEPMHALYAGYLMSRGFDRKVTYLNPQCLSSDQLKCDPVLFIHGDSSNSGLFVPMIEKIAKESPHTPIFTIELTSSDGIVSAKNHLDLIVGKVNEIADLYQPSSRTPKISFVGHSSGGDVLGPLMRRMEERKGPESGTIIKIGSIFKKTDAEEFCELGNGKVIEIVGTRDILEGYESHLPNQLVVDSGHLGLLFNETVLERVLKEITV